MINTISRLYYAFRGGVLSVPGRIIVLAFIICLLLMPLMTSHPFILRMLSMAAIFAIYAASWDLLAGFTGQLSLGHALFFGVSAYTAALLNLRLGFSPWLTIPLGGAASVLAGLVVALPSLKLRGFYLALVTLAYPLILTGLVFVFPDVTGGEFGLYGLKRLSGSRLLSYYIVTVVMLVSVFVMWKLTDSKSKIVRLGVILHSIREDEIAARVSGINTTFYKVLAFCISGFFAGIAGGLYAHYLRIAGPSTLELFFSFQPILWTIFGGITSIYGPVTGVYILYPVIDLLRMNPFLEQFRFVIFSLLLILILLFMPEGVASWVRDRIEVDCPRCKIINSALRRSCRACRAPLHLSQKGTAK